MQKTAYKIKTLDIIPGEKEQIHYRCEPPYIGKYEYVIVSAIFKDIKKLVREAKGNSEPMGKDQIDRFLQGDMTIVCETYVFASDSKASFGMNEMSELEGSQKNVFDAELPLIEQGYKIIDNENKASNSSTQRP